MSFGNAESAVRFLLSKTVVDEESGRVVETGSSWLVMPLVEGREEVTSLADDDEVGRAKEGIDAAADTVGDGGGGGILSRCISSVMKTICCLCPIFGCRSISSARGTRVSLVNRRFSCNSFFAACATGSLGFLPRFPLTTTREPAAAAVEEGAGCTTMADGDERTTSEGGAVAEGAATGATSCISGWPASATNCGSPPHNLRFEGVGSLIRQGGIVSSAADVEQTSGGVLSGAVPAIVEVALVVVSMVVVVVVVVVVVREDG